MEELDQIILDLVHEGSMLPPGKTINAGMFPEAKAKLAALLAKQEEDLLHRFADRMSWEIALGNIEMVSTNLETLLAQLHQPTQQSSNTEGGEA